MQNGEKTATQEQNELWNEIHVNLVRDLERKGILWRYGVKHLKLWTDMILDGKCSGVGEEPQWEEHLEQVIIPPRAEKVFHPQTPPPPVALKVENLTEALLN